MVSFRAMRVAADDVMDPIGAWTPVYAGTISAPNGSSSLRSMCPTFAANRPSTT
jgi:hypothetical protein